jgi:hypothetical protein
MILAHSDFNAELALIGAAKATTPWVLDDDVRYVELLEIHWAAVAECGSKDLR